MDGRSYATNTLHESYGRGVHTIDDDGLVTEDELLGAMRARFASPNYRPPVLPAVAVQVHALTQKGSASIQDVIALVERDAMLAADVVRRAQSPMYAGRGPMPRTLLDAALRLGTQGLGELVLEVALKSRVFRAKGLDGPMLLLQRHSVIVAHAARAVSRRAGASDPDAAFLCGLLHDVGLVAALQTLGDVSKSRPIDLASAVPALRACADEAGALLVSLWGLPAFVQRSIERHHAPGGFDIDACIDDPIAACVLLGDSLAVMLGAGTMVASTQLDGHPARAVQTTMQSLGLTDADLEEIRLGLEHVVEGAR